MKFEVTEYHICIPLSAKQWNKLSKIDDIKRKDWPEKYEEMEKVIDQEGGYGINFNGHFGRNFFFRVENLEDAAKVTAKLEEILGK